MSEDGEKRGGSAIPGVLGAVAGAGGAALYVDRKMTNRGINAALAGQTAPKGFADKVTGALAKDSALATQKDALGVLRTAGDKNAINTAEKALTTNVRKVGEFKMGDGLRGIDKAGIKGLNGATKLKYAGVAVAGVVAGAVVFNKLFGGRHSKRVEAERQVQQDLGRA